MALALSFLALVTTALAVTPQSASRGNAVPQVTVEWLKSLKATSNTPSGDAFVGSREELTRIVDAIVADSSLVSPMYLFFASKTALTLGRVADAGFLFYAAQLRAAFDFERLDVSRRPDGNNAATYLGFLRHTIGEIVNPAIMREPKQFAAVMDRLDRWELAPSPQAYYPEFEPLKGFKIPPEQWKKTADDLKTEFMTVFGRRQARLLNDPEYFAAFRFVQSMNFGEVPDTAENRARFKKSTATMDAIEARLFPEPAVPKPPPVAKDQPPARPAVKDPSKPPTVRAGTDAPVPVLVHRVEPQFPPNSKGVVILEVTVGVSGAVEDVRILRGIPALDAAALRAVREWRYSPTEFNGKPVRVVLTVTVTAGKE